MHRNNPFRSLDLKHKFVPDKNIQSIPHRGQLLPCIDERHRNFDLYTQPRLGKFKRETAL